MHAGAARTSRQSGPVQAVHAVHRVVDGEFKIVARIHSRLALAVPAGDGWCGNCTVDRISGLLRSALLVDLQRRWRWLAGFRNPKCLATMAALRLTSRELVGNLVGLVARRACEMNHDAPTRDTVATPPPNDPAQQPGPPQVATHIRKQSGGPGLLQRLVRRACVPTATTPPDRSARPRRPSWDRSPRRGSSPSSRRQPQRRPQRTSPAGSCRWPCSRSPGSGPPTP